MSQPTPPFSDWPRKKLERHAERLRNDVLRYRGALQAVLTWVVAEFGGGETDELRLRSIGQIAPQGAGEEEVSVQRADWVTTNDGGRGFVKRVARDGSWADVLWREPTLGEWVKRMPTSALIVQHAIPIGDGWTVTDLDRQEELER